MCWITSLEIICVALGQSRCLWGLRSPSLFCCRAGLELSCSPGVPGTGWQWAFLLVRPPVVGEIWTTFLSLQVCGFPRSRLHLLTLPGFAAHWPSGPPQWSHTQLCGHLCGGSSAQRDHLGRGVAAGWLRHRDDR